MSGIERAIVEDTATPDQVAAVEAAFARHGVTVRVEASYGRHAGDVLPWVLHIALAVPIGAFLTAFAAEAGKDAYAAFKAWFADLRATRGGDGAAVLEDPDRSVLVLPADLPEEALEQLRDLDLVKHAGDYLVWDRERREWRDPTKRG